MEKHKLYIEAEQKQHEKEIELLTGQIFGPGRFARAPAALREIGIFDQQHSFVACMDNKLVGSIRMMQIVLQKRKAFLLGPLLVEQAYRGQKIGEALVKHALASVQHTDAILVMLIGDFVYYKRLGFEKIPYGHVQFLRPVDPDRILFFPLCAKQECEEFLENLENVLVMPLQYFPLRHSGTAQKSG